MYDFVAKAALTEIAQTSGHTVDIVVQRILKVLVHPFIEGKHTFSFILSLFLLIRQLFLLNFDMILLRQPFQCLGIGHLFQLHEEVHRITALAA